MATRTRPNAKPAKSESAETDLGDADLGEANRVTASLAGLAAALLLVVLGLALVHHLYTEGRVEDCLMAGRSNCDQLLAVR